VPDFFPSAACMIFDYPCSVCFTFSPMANI
jgi:hypothetical protein